MFEFFNKNETTPEQITLPDNIEVIKDKNIIKFHIKNNCTLNEYLSFFNKNILKYDREFFDKFPFLNDDFDVSKKDIYYIKNNNYYLSIQDCDDYIFISDKTLDTKDYIINKTLYFLKNENKGSVYYVNYNKKNKKRNEYFSFNDGNKSCIENINKANYLIKDILYDLENVDGINKYINIDDLYNKTNYLFLNTYHPIVKNKKIALSLSSDNFEHNYFDNRNCIKFDIVLQKSKVKVGEIFFDYFLADGFNYSGNVSYYIRSNFRNRGYATEALKLLKEFLCSENFNKNIKILLAIKPTNISSMKVATNNGAKLIYDGEVPDNEPINYIDGAKKIKIYKIDI